MWLWHKDRNLLLSILVVCVVKPNPPMFFLSYMFVALFYGSVLTFDCCVDCCVFNIRNFMFGPKNYLSVYVASCWSLYNSLFLIYRFPSDRPSSVSSFTASHPNLVLHAKHTSTWQPSEHDHMFGSCSIELMLLQ